MTVIKTDLTNHILTVTIARPEAMNALNADVLSQLSEVISRAYTDAEIGGIILIGEGEKAFVAGADIKELSVLSPTEALTLAEKGQRIFKAIEDSPKPIIAAVNGFALGGGCELAMACHFRVATENAKFGQPEVNLGIIPGYGGTQRLTQLVGRGKALELLLTGDVISAQQALSLGLVNHVVADRQALTVLATSIMTKILAKGSIAVRHVIQAVNAGFDFEKVGYQTEAKLFGDCAGTADFKEGTSAFMEKRKPTFTGK
ncbi:enoyl-CoA hydratase-related protein [Pseudochryseolinea flava]|uniref:Enoyl-CoA hydratase n=1 Tax=Pseudochryseolinea flava TaxID=2059302 RepID=A0A364Y0G7_9BACT|nr:enoyl-CoA hydratase-related protein [Pseudochryseolinea flava]RAV99772.1 enoyl-CoA hydratase [Pseudochryseolinea flava]